MEILHVSSLVHDDIIDNAPFRRNIKTVHQIYPIQECIFIANYMMGRAGRYLT